MKPRTLNCITALTDAEWPADHPLRRIAGAIVTDEGLATWPADAISLVCGKPDEPRLPCPSGDADLPASCRRCGCDLLRRRSANPEWKSICFQCWEIIS